MSPSKPYPVLRRVGKRRLIVIAAFLVILALIAGGAAYALLGRATATVTITPTSQLVSNTYTLAAVTGAPDASKQQVGARLVSATTPAATKTVSASGHLSVPATGAKGMLVLRNWDTKAPITFKAGTIFPDINGDRVLLCPSTAGIKVMLDATVTIPAADPSRGPGIAYAPAHPLETGTVGNIPLNTQNGEDCYYYLWVNGHCPSGWLGYCWTVEPAKPFTGGQDAYDGPAVQQSDIDSAANSLISAHQPDAQRVLQPEMKANERPLSAPSCAPQVKANHQAGDHAAQVTISVAFTCAGAVYDQQAARALITPMLSAQAAADPGAGYALAGQVQLAVTNAAPVPGEQGTMMLTITAAGIWAYHFTNAQKQHLATLLSGKSAQEATRLASNQPGVADVSIRLSANQQTLPTDPKQIAVVVQAVPAA